MPATITIEKMSDRLCDMNKTEMKDQLLHFPGHIKLDFTEDYLDTLNEDRLRHILMAAIVTESHNYE